MERSNWLVRMAIVIFAAAMLMSACESRTGNGTNVPQPETNRPKEPAAGSDGKFVLGETPLAFSFFGNYDWYAMQPWGEDPATQWIKENKKVTVTNIPSGGAAAQKLSTMIASGELPDVIFTERGADVEQLRRAGKLVPLDPYLEKYPNLKKWATPATINLLRSEDGKLYQFPNWYTSTPTGNGGYSINTKIYTELGSPKLETFDDLYQYLKIVKEKYPNVIPFEVSISGQGIDVLYSGFANDHPTMFITQLAVPRGDKLTSIFTDPVYRETMIFASKLYREKLIPPDALTQTLDQVREKVTSGKVAVMAAYNVTDLTRRGEAALRDKDPEAGYNLIWPLRKPGVDKNKVWPTQYDSTGWNVNVITANAKNPEGIYAYLDWLTGEEGQRILNFGPEGLYWSGTDEAGVPLLKPNYYDETKEINRLVGVWDTFQWAGNSTFMSKAWEGVEKQRPPDKKKESRPTTAINLQTSFNATEFVNLDPEPSSEEGIIDQRVRDIYYEAKAKALNAKSDEAVVAILDKANQDANQAGYEKLLQYKTDRWHENLKKMGGK